MNIGMPGHTKQRLLLQQELIIDISRLFIGNSETDAMIARALQMTGEFLELGRVTLLYYQQRSLNCQYEWYDQNRPAASKLGGVRPLTDTEVQDIEALAERGVACYNLDEADREDIISRYGLDAVTCLFLTVFCEDNFWGLLEFDRCADYTPWTAADICLGKTVAALLSLALSRHSREDHLQKSLNEAKQAADQASQAKADFLSRMSHEMRTPMNAIIGMTDIALSSKDMDKMEYCLNKIDNASRHLLNVINDILDMSKLETSKLKLSLDEFDFEQALMGIIDVIRSLAEEKRQDLIISIDSRIPRSLIGDELRIGQVIINLLTNAIKFTQNGGVIKLSVSQIAEEEDWHTLQAEITDNGIGISEAQQARLFTSFEQGDGSFARKYGGTGLGLAICKHIVNLMDGDIRVKSTINQGSTFIFTMKLQKGKRQLEQRLSGIIDRGEIEQTAEKKDDSYKPILYNHQQEREPAETYAGFLPLIDVISGLNRVMNNKTLYFTLLNNFSGRALADEMIAHIKNKDHKQTEHKAVAIRSMAASLGLNELQRVLDDIEGHAKMEVSSIALIDKLEEIITETLCSIKRLLEGEGIK